MRVLIVFALACGVSWASEVAAKTPAKSGATSETKSATSPAKKTDPTPDKPTADPSGPALNACGCYEDGAGVCHCAKKSQCGCPGTCEPAGCEEKRQKQLAKEAEEELRQQQLEDKKRNAELAKKAEEADRQDAQKRERGLRGLRLIEEKK